METPTARSGEQAVVVGPRARAHLGRLCREHADSVLVVTDTRLEAATSHVRATVEHLTSSRISAQVLTLPTQEAGTVEAARNVHDRMRESRTRLCIALGGGSVIDTAKLARAGTHEPWLFDRAVWHRSSGLVNLRRPRTCDVPPQLIAVPTRPGTAAEVSARAALTTGSTETRRLVTGETLRPTAALVDPDYGDTLPRPAWAEALSEILFRVLGPFLVTRRSSERVDRTAAGWIEELVGLGTRAAERTPLPVEQRRRVAELSVATATGEHVHLWEPAMPVWWCVQNTLTTRTGLTKGVLTAKALPTLLEMVAEGQENLGSADRLCLLDHYTAEGTVDALGALCTTVQDTEGRRRRPSSERELTEWGQEVRTLWSHHPDVVSLGADGIAILLRRLGF